jgi:uncharacterized protein (TIGR02284 family)
MSNDRKVTEDLIQTCKDGSEGFAKAADKLGEAGKDDLAAQFRSFGTERGQFASELEGLARQYGDDADAKGSVAAAVHRGWMSVKDALAGSKDPEGVLDVAEQGEDHAKSEYAKALDEDISPTLRTVVERQYAAVQHAHDTVRDLRNSYAA